MTKPTRIEVNCATGEQTVIELTDAEIAELEALSTKAAEERAARDQEAAAIQAVKESAHAKLIALGLTEEEIAALTK